MSTPTPQTDAAQFDATQVSEEGGAYLVVGVDFARTLETEVTAALARIAELEKLERRVCKWVRARSITEDAPAGDLIQLMNDHDKRKSLRLDHYEREIDSLTRQLAESQAKLAEASHVCHCRASTIATLEAQLAAAREDGARIEWIGREVAYFELCGTEFKDGRLISIGLDARIDIDSARGVTSPPTPAETATESTEENL